MTGNRQAYLATSKGEHGAGPAVCRHSPVMSGLVVRRSGFPFTGLSFSNGGRRFPPSPERDGPLAIYGQGPGDHQAPRQLMATRFAPTGSQRKAWSSIDPGPWSSLPAWTFPAGKRPRCVPASGGISAMNGPEPTSDNRKDPEIAAAELLFQDAEPPASTRPVGPVIATGSSEGFELADVSEHSASPPPSSQSAPSREAASGKPADSRPRARMVAPVAPAVEQVWSRGSEWGSTFVVLACWIAAILGIAYFTLGAELYGTTGLILLVGGLGAVVLSYPILITLERPVRITPEQAARDYFGALSHHFPHYRRMWLLLSARGAPRPNSHRMRVSRRTGSHGSASSMRGTPAGSLPWSFRLRSSTPRRAPERPRSMPASGCGCWSEAAAARGR